MHAAGAFRHVEIGTPQAKKIERSKKIGICLTCLNFALNVPIVFKA